MAIASASVAPLAVSVRGVSMRYRATAGVVHALADVSLDVAPGEFVSIIGPSGCGKSTLLRLVADILAPTAGTIAIDGLSTRDARKGRAYSFVFQNPVLFPWLNLRENVEFGLKIVGSARRDRAAEAEAMIGLVGLAGFEDAYPNQLSGGMRQRAAIARALTMRPDLLLMDEPFGALDEITRERMNFELLRILAQTGAAVLFVTHSIDEAVILSDRIVVMSPRPGRFEEIVPIDLPRPRSSATRYAPEFVAITHAVRRVLHRADVDTFG